MTFPYELGVEIGRWVEVDGEVVEQRFGIDYVVALSREPDSVGFWAFIATDADVASRFVLQLAEWPLELAAPQNAELGAVSRRFCRGTAPSSG